jgi:Na+-translocating ferredoxin:NAD+ oxidoreductase RnfA subunit
MYQRARKLQDIVTDAASFVSLAEDQLEALSIAINALYLVDEKAAWILMPLIPDPVRTLVMMLINASQCQFSSHENVKNSPNIFQSPSTFRANMTPTSFNFPIWNMNPHFFEPR